MYTTQRQCSSSPSTIESRSVFLLLAATSEGIERGVGCFRTDSTKEAWIGTARHRNSNDTRSNLRNIQFIIAVLFIAITIVGVLWW